MLANKPIARFGDARRDIGRVVVFLASGDASYLTGQTFWVAGGGTIHS